MIEHPGIYPEAPYRTENLTPTPYLTQSGIKVLLTETPADFRHPSRKPASTEMDFGSIVHKLALGKGAQFAVSPFDDYRTKDARAWRDDTIEAGLIPIKADKYDDAMKIAAAIIQKINHVLQGAEYLTEVPFFWQEGGVWCGGCMDVWCPDLLIAIDPKVTNRIGRRAQSHMINMGWDIQAAWYRRGLEKIMPDLAGHIRFANILVKPDEPFTARVIALNEAWRHSAEQECLRALRIFQTCQANDEWPGYPDGIEELDAPTWALNERVMAGAMEEGE